MNSITQICAKQNFDMKTMRQTEMTATRQREIELINGIYTPEEAQEVVTHVLLKKINFHEMRDLSQQIRFGLKDENSKVRIEELKASLEAFRKLTKEATLSGKSVKLESKISVEFI